ncbi:MAG: DISARM system helicase DrmA, partial [Deltaproteobacteria bacterium]|nr:DISARM system helicase DrmA [Deltaproteobacteria bacterium]
QEEGQDKPRTVWRRVAREPVSLGLALDAAKVARGVEVPGYPGVHVTGKLAQVAAAESQGLEPGTRALSLFVVNNRPVGERGKEDEAFLFQVRMELSFAGGFVPRPNRRGEGAEEWDERVADLQFRHRFEYAVGHGVAVEVVGGAAGQVVGGAVGQGDAGAVGQGRGGPVTTVATTWLPRAEVPPVITHEETDVVTEMERLAELHDAESVETALGALVIKYGQWIEAQRGISLESKARRQTRDTLMANAETAMSRIASGIRRLQEDAQVREAFCLANRAMAMAAVQRNPERYEQGGAGPAWRLFQLAFLLLNLDGMSDETHADRENVELLFFPTGGGKTEAYLGVIAFALVLRRLRGQARPDGGLGVAVLLRYTLRLLTLDQLGRAATLMCALEQIRQEDTDRLGDVRFAVGLWVGRSATANTMSAVAKAVTEYKNAASGKAESPFPLPNCPWCGKALGKGSLTLKPTSKKPTEVVVGCQNMKCPFSARKNPEGLPVVFVDEQVYRELPAFIVATVDKFAMLPWRGETGMLFGRVQGRQGKSFFGPMDKMVRGAKALPEGLRPPELIVQDELHLISGPLGTMVGLYETAVDALCSRQGDDGRDIRPKILASTATVRRANFQVQALFGRKTMSLFPPPGVDDSETWFATVDRSSPGRQYVGVAAPGRSMKGNLLRVYVDLLAAAKRAYDPKGRPDQTADAYMTLAGYFNALRELGGMRRLVEDDVRTRCTKIEDRRTLDHQGKHPWFANRALKMEPVELTSRESTGRIKDAKDRLTQPYADKGHVDVLLASNMISVGVDIDRLGLMVVAGQPKTTSEYIQSSSRVGRQVRWPGLVVTCLNLHKPRDRSHYEHFKAYHDSFYRFVEAQSLTPFSGPALERGFAGTLLAMIRLLEPALTKPSGAMRLGEYREVGERAVRLLAERGAALAGPHYEEVKAALMGRGRSLLDSWEVLIKEAREGAGSRSYSRFDKEKSAGSPLLYLVLDEVIPAPGSDAAKFAAPTSMRDVEPTVSFWLCRGQLGGRF